MNINNEFVYLLQEREFIKTNEPIFKIGMTKQSGLTRFNQYPKGSKLLIHINCDDSRLIEGLAISKFKQQFIQRRDIGIEYFEGDYFKMMEILFKIVAESRKKELPELPKLSESPIIVQPVNTYNYYKFIKRDPITIMTSILRANIYKFWLDDKLFGGKHILTKSINDSVLVSINQDVFNYEFDIVYNEYEFEVINVDGEQPNKYICLNEILPVGITGARKIRCSNDLWIYSN